MLREFFTVGGGVGAQPATEEGQCFHHLVVRELLHLRFDFGENRGRKLDSRGLACKPSFRLGRTTVAGGFRHDRRFPNRAMPLVTSERTWGAATVNSQGPVAQIE